MMDSLIEEGEFFFLYQLVEGYVRLSYVSYVVLQVGLFQEIVKRGKEVNVYRDIFMIDLILLYVFCVYIISLK